MKIIDGFKLRNIAGEMVVSGEGVGQINFNNLIVLNSTAAFLWEQVEGKEFDVEMLANLLIENFEVDSETARKDATMIAQKWVEVKIVSDEER